MTEHTEHSPSLQRCASAVSRNTDEASTRTSQRELSAATPRRPAHHCQFRQECWRKKRHEHLATQGPTCQPMSGSQVQSLSVPHSYSHACVRWSVYVGSTPLSMHPALHFCPSSSAVCGLRTALSAPAPKGAAKRGHKFTASLLALKCH